MLTTIQTIKSELADSFDWLTEDNLEQFVDGYVPIYTNEIIAEWTLMPSEYDNSWMEYTEGESFKRTITDLMALDLYNYYRDQVRVAYEELIAENEAEAESEDNE